MKHPLFSVLAVIISLLAFTPTGYADELNIATLNCYLCFKPGTETGGQLASKGPTDVETYGRKIANLSSLLSGANIAGLQEVGSDAEPADLAATLKCNWAFVQGRDTYTGEDVAAMYSLPDGYRFQSVNRIAKLDRVVSKHILLTIQGPKVRFRVLIVHLAVSQRDEEKNAKQRSAIDEWLTEQLSLQPNDVFIVVGDLNKNSHGPLLGHGLDALSTLAYPATHYTGLCLDRIIVAGPATVKNVSVKRPSYGPRPNALNRMNWTDHYCVTATVTSS